MAVGCSLIFVDFGVVLLSSINWRQWLMLGWRPVYV